MRMIMLGSAFLLLVAPGVLLPAQPPGPKDEAATPPGDSTPKTVIEDQRALRDHGVGADGPALLDYFKKRTVPAASPKEVAILIARLGDEDFEVREHAFDRLLTLGAGALADIKVAEKSADAEVGRRADELRVCIEAKVESHLHAAAARLLAVSRPAGAAGVLLDFLPCAADPQVVDEICKTLAAVAVSGEKIEPCLVQALADKIPLKRAAAAEACIRARLTDQAPAARGLLHDADPTVRLRVALALAPLRDKEVVPVLVDLLADLSPEQAWPAEDILARLAGDQAPPICLGATKAQRKECRDAWRRWLDNHGGTLNLARLAEAPALLGYTLIVQRNNNPAGPIGGLRRGPVGEVLEIDSGKNQLWKFAVPPYAVDAQVVRVDGAERVLLAEYQAGRISEYDFQGAMKWDRPVNGNPIGAQRLANGNTFVVMQGRLVEIDRAGKTSFTLTRATPDIFRARKLRGGDVVFVTNGGVLTRLDGRTQKVLKMFSVGPVPEPFGSIDVLPDGGVLVPDFHQNRVVEYTADGKKMKTFSVQRPSSVMRLPNGHTLIASHDMRRLGEFDGGGREVWSHILDGFPFNVRGR